MIKWKDSNENTKRARTKLKNLPQNFPQPCTDGRIRMEQFDWDGKIKPGRLELFKKKNPLVNWNSSTLLQPPLPLKLLENAKTAPETSKKCKT